MAFGFIKNFHIWPSYGQKMARIPILGHTFFGYNSAISWLIGQKIFMGIPSYDAYFSVLIFWPLSAGKLAWPPRALLMAWGLQTQPKSWPTGRTFWDNCYLEIMFAKFSGVNPPLNPSAGLCSWHVSPFAVIPYYPFSYCS